MDSTDATKALLPSSKDVETADSRMEGGVRRIGFPSGSLLTISRKGDDLLEITLPRNGLSSRARFFFVFFLLYVSIIAITFVDLDALSARSIDSSGLQDVCFKCPLGMLAAAVLIVSLVTLLEALSRRHLSFSRSSFSIHSSLFGRRCGCKRGNVEGRADDIGAVKVVVSGGQFSGFMTAVEVSAGVRSHRVGANLSVAEKQWLVQQIGEFVGCPYSTAVQLA